MSAIHIRWLYDSMHCEACGTACAEGAEVTLDGQPLVTLKPVAACVDEVSWSEEEVFRAILHALGHEITEEHDDA